jgi:2-C-methyl-D-erythritol 2,4-cyclodiphosphate synthase
MRVGTGYDVHPLVRGRRLMLGGIEVPFDQGLEGHSDGDAVIHAIIDALLGAAGLGDIGIHFPSSDPGLKGISSLILLQRIRSLLEQDGWHIANVDATIIAERPKLTPYVPQMREAIARALEVETERISVKSTTSKGLGFIGQGQAIAVHAVALVTGEVDR